MMENQSSSPRRNSDSDGDWVEGEEVIFSNKKLKKMEQERLQEIKMKSFGSPKGKLVSSEEILNRIKWDPQYPYDQFTIGYLDRFSGMMEMPVEVYLDTDDVDRFPMHRVYYFKINGEKVWERDTKLDLISTGEARKYVISREGDKPQSKHAASEQQNTNGNDNTQNTQDMDKRQQTSEEENKKEPINIFSNKRNRACYKEYIPEDALESYMHKVNVRELALKDPTHVSQRGGYYHIPKSHFETLLKKWKESIELKEEFFMEEARTPLFRLFIDIDFKTTDGKKIDMVEKGYIPIIQKFTDKFLRKYVPSKLNISRTVIVTETHGKWTDQVSQDANYKSGYRLYYPSIFVDEHIITKYLTKLAKTFEDTVQFYHPYQPKDWKWEDVIDVKQATHKRGRMFGTSKWRRGNVLGRVYEFTGAFDDEGNLNEPLTQFLKESLESLLYLTSIRYDRNVNFTQKSDIQIIQLTKDGYERELYPIINLKNDFVVDGRL